MNDNEIAADGGAAFTDLNEGEASFTVKAGQTIAAGTVITLPWGERRRFDDNLRLERHDRFRLRQQQ